MAPEKQRKSSQGPTTIASTPQKSSSPVKKTRIMGISIAQKQALIDNLQLEITERARRLRAQYNIQAQQLRSRVEMRINRIPTTLRKAKMGELLAKSLAPSQPPKPPKSPYVAARPPPVPPKDGAAPPPVARKPVPMPVAKAAARGQKRMSEEISSADKENRDTVENPKKRIRGAPAVEPPRVQHGQVLSPTSSNARIIPARERPPSPAKPTFSRPASPMKASATKPSSNLLSNMVEKAKGTRGAPLARNATTASSASTSSASTTASRTKKAAAPSSKPPSKPASRPATATATRGRRKVSESSEASTGTVVKKATGAASKTATAKTTAPTAKRTVMSTIKSAAAKKAPPTKTHASATTGTGTGTGRTLRKRG